MSNEELTNLLIGRRERLSEEANAALTAVLEEKDPAKFAREIQDKVADLNAQALAASEEVRRHDEHSRRARRGMLVFLVVAAAILGVVFLLRR